MEIVPNGSGSTDELPAACVDVGGNGVVPQVRSRDRRVVCSLSLAAPEFGPRKLYTDLGRAAGQDVAMYAGGFVGIRTARSLRTPGVAPRAAQRNAEPSSASGAGYTSASAA